VVRNRLPRPTALLPVSLPLPPAFILLPTTTVIRPHNAAADRRIASRTAVRTDLLSHHTCHHHRARLFQHAVYEFDRPIGAQKSHSCC